jgi:hypothetical protein
MKDGKHGCLEQRGSEAQRVVTATWTGSEAEEATLRATLEPQKRSDHTAGRKAMKNGQCEGRACNLRRKSLPCCCSLGYDPREGRGGCQMKAT